MKILVTGGAGFIGSHYIHYMLNSYPDVSIVCLDALTYAGSLDNLADIPEDGRFTFVKGNIAVGRTVDRVMREHAPRLIVNFAAETHVDRSIASPDVFTRTNVLGTSVLLGAAVRHGGVRFHQISTDEVYGSLPPESPERFTELSPLSPSSPYAASKAAADLLALSFYKTYGLPVTVSRCSNNYGERQHEEKLIPKAISLAAKNEAVPIYGTGENVRDWIYVGDHVRAIDLIIREGRIGEIYNIGADCELSNTAVVKKLLSLLDKPDSLLSYVTDRKGHDLRYAIDHSKLSSELHWEPTVGFDEGLSITINGYNSRTLNT